MRVVLADLSVDNLWPCRQPTAVRYTLSREPAHPALGRQAASHERRAQQYIAQYDTGKSEIKWSEHPLA